MPDHAVLHRILDHRAHKTGRHVGRAQAAVAEMGGQRHAAVDHGNGLRRAQRAGRRFHLELAVFGSAVAKLAKNAHHAAHFGKRRRLGGQFQAPPHLPHALFHNGHFLVFRGRNRQHHRVEATLERGGELVHALVAVVRRGDHVEAAHGLHFLAELGHGQRLFRKNGDERVLHVGGDAGQFLHAGDAAVFHGAHERTFHQCLPRRPLGQQLGVVPAVAHLFLARARRALNDARGIAAHGRGQMLRHPRLGRARHAVQKQRAIGGQRGHGDFHEPATADVLGRDLKAVVEPAAHEIGTHGPGRHLPVLRARMRVGLLQFFQLFGKLLFGVLTQHAGGVFGIYGAHAMPSMVDGQEKYSSIVLRCRAMAEKRSKISRFGESSGSAART